jgi:hypothetical protein
MSETSENSAVMQPSSENGQRLRIVSTKSGLRWMQLQPYSTRKKSEEQHDKQSKKEDTADHR